MKISNTDDTDLYTDVEDFVLNRKPRRRKEIIFIKSSCFSGLRLKLAHA